MESAAGLYLVQNQNALEENVVSQEISLQELIDKQSIKTVHDSGNGKTCEGKVIVTSENKKIDYKGCLKCSNYVTEDCGFEEEIVIEDKKPCEMETEVIAGVTHYYIDSVSDLYQFSKEVNQGNYFSGKTIELRNNLNMIDTSNTCGMESFEPIGNDSKHFSGTFEGNAKTISNLTINKPDQNYVGLFGYNSGTIKGLNIENINVKGNYNVGGLVGYNYEKINEVSMSGNVEGNNNVGGLVGTSNGGYKHTVSVLNVLSSANVKGNDNVGGLVGAIVPGSSYAYSKVSGITESGIIEGNTNVSKITTKVTTDEYLRNNYLYVTGYTGSDVVLNGTQGEFSESGNIFEKKYYNDLNYYGVIFDTVYIGDKDTSGYYYNYNAYGNDIVVVKAE